MKIGTESIGLRFGRHYFGLRIAKRFCIQMVGAIGLVRIGPIELKWVGRNHSCNLGSLKLWVHAPFREVPCVH